MPKSASTSNVRSLHASHRRFVLHRPGFHPRPQHHPSVMGVLSDVRCIVCQDDGCEFCPIVLYPEVPDVSRIVTLLPAHPETHIVVGYDRFYGHFVQCYTNGLHTDECDCPQCEYDSPAYELDHGASWQAAYAFITEHFGPEVAQAVRTNVEAAGSNATSMNFAA